MNISSRFGNNADRQQSRRGLASVRRRPTHQAGWKMRQIVLHNRIKELLVFEIHRDGNREYRNMTLRELYNYVLAAITTRPDHLQIISPESVTRSMRNVTMVRNATASFRRGTPGVQNLASFTDINSKASYPNAACSSDHNVDSTLEQEEEEEQDGYDGKGEDIRKERPSAKGSLQSNTLDDMLGSGIPERQPHRNTKVSFQRNDSTGTPISTTASDKAVAPSTAHVTYRERLGGYLHPRDMRRLVTPFSASNEPELIVRRHVVLLNFDPLRAIVLRDRLLVLVPDGADSILETLSQRIKGGLSEMEDSVFGKEHNSTTSSDARGSNAKAKGGVSFDESRTSSNGDDSHHSTTETGPLHSLPDASEKSAKKRLKKKHIRAEEKFDSHQSDDDNDSDISDSVFDAFDDDEWDDMQGRQWAALPFELQSIDAVLHTVVTMLIDEANDLQEHSYGAIEQLLEAQTSIGDHGHDLLRSIKGELTQMRGRVQGFIRAINLVLNEDEDMALMNLSRLITHADRFIQPVSEEILHEESDEPELILEAYLQQALSNTNALDLLRSEVATTEELMNMKLDTVRNRLLYVNTVVSLLTLTVGIGSFIGSIFGMNLLNGLEQDQDAFSKVVLGTCFGALGLLILLVIVFYKAGLTLPGMS